MINVEVHVGKLKLFEDFYVVDMEREPTCPLLAGRGFLATANVVIDCKKAKMVVEEGLTRSIFGVKELDFGDDNETYWTTIGKRESYKPRTSKDGIEYSEEEVAETMAKTMDQYMSKTRADYGSGVASPKIEDKDNFELKGQFLKELRTNTFSGLDHEDANEHIKKVLEILRNEPTGSITNWDGLKTKFLNKYCPPAQTAKKMEEINNFQQEPDENLYQAWERFKELLMKCPQHYLTKMQEVILFYNGLGIPTRQILDSRGAIPSKTAADAKKKGKPLMKITTRNLVDLFKEGDIEQQLWDSIKGTMQILRTKNEVKLISTTIDADSSPIRHIGSSQYAISTGQNRALMYETRQMMIPFLSRLNGYYCEEKKGSYGPQFSEDYSKASHINNSIPRKDKDPGSFTLSFFINNVCFNNALVDLGANVSVMPCWELCIPDLLPFVILVSTNSVISINSTK
ncbi:hypothetical protein Tco_0963341 [Tanacetum coccineum]